MTDIADSLNPEAQAEVERYKKRQESMIDEQLRWIEEGNIFHEFGMKTMDQSEKTEVFMIKKDEHVLDVLDKLVANKIKMTEKERQAEIKKT